MEVNPSGWDDYNDGYHAGRGDKKKKPVVKGERDNYNYARLHQGFEGSFSDWMALSESEREEYEAGAQGIGTRGNKDDDGVEIDGDDLGLDPEEENPGADHDASIVDHVDSSRKPKKSGTCDEEASQLLGDLLTGSRIDPKTASMLRVALAGVVH
jgi:hypothetical protein